MKRHKGAREFTGEEMGNLATGQGGFKIITNATVECVVTSGYTDITYFIALKAIDADAEILARVYQGVPGDDLCTNGNFSTGAALTVGNGDIVYGVFDKVTVASGDYVIAYIGK